MARCVIFLGPSLPHRQARQVVGEGCDIRPPVRRGDLPELEDDVDIIAIIDGVFLGEAAVGHREIMDKLRQGVQVVGGGSMGALRASELHPFGMKGIGEIYRCYKNGEIEGDDEVALIFNPEDLEALSEPLVNMRHNLMEATVREIIRPRERDELLSALKALYYPKRTKERMLEAASDILDDASLSEFELFVRDEYTDIKREDALEVLLFVKENTAKKREKAKKGGTV